MGFLSEVRWEVSESTEQGSDWEVFKTFPTEFPYESFVLYNNEYTLS